MRKNTEMPLGDNETYANELYDDIQKSMQHTLPFMLPEELLECLSKQQVKCIHKSLMEAAAWGAFWATGFLEGHRCLNDDPDKEMQIITKKGRSLYMEELLMSRLQRDFPNVLVGKPADSV